MFFTLDFIMEKIEIQNWTGIKHFIQKIYNIIVKEITGSKSIHKVIIIIFNYLTNLFSKINTLNFGGF